MVAWGAGTVDDAESQQRPDWFQHRCGTQATQEVRQQMDALRHKLEELDRAMQTGDADMP